MSNSSHTISFIQTIKSTYRDLEIPFMEKQLHRVKQSKPYQGLSVLQNIPFTRETLIKSEILIEGGADLTITSPSFMNPDPLLISSFIEAGGRFVNQEDLGNETFDFHLDCAAELMQRKSPRIGTVEITGTGTNKYGEAAIDYPVISIDMCEIKNLEGMLGTGEAFVRAFTEITKENITNRAFMIFGYGKVGKGIANYLKREGANITIVDLNATFLNQAQREGFASIHALAMEDIEKAAESMFCIVTATGRDNVISKNYRAQLFKNKYLANMGVDDEFGFQFTDDEILCQKKPINFFISTPTMIRYLDPVFYAHNLGIDILLYSNLENGLHPFPGFLAEEVVQNWTMIFKEYIDF